MKWTQLYQYNDSEKQVTFFISDELVDLSLGY